MTLNESAVVCSTRKPSVLFAFQKEMNSGPQAPLIAGHLMGSIHMKVHIFLKASAQYGLLCKRENSI